MTVPSFSGARGVSGRPGDGQSRFVRSTFTGTGVHAEEDGYRVTEEVKNVKRPPTNGGVFPDPRNRSDQTQDVPLRLQS